MKRGFTLIELLMSIAIIAILSTITLGLINSTQAKGRDSKAIREFQEVRSALALYQNEFGRYPNETPILSNPYIDNFNSMATELVSRGYLAKVPTPPAGRSYHYYNYGPGEIGALLVTSLETYPESTGYSGSCRPWASGQANWCTTDASHYYCLCLKY